jgi:5-formyltetrahydrofolate cyclo-ligase
LIEYRVPDAEKVALRARMKALRAALTADRRNALSRQITTHARAALFQQLAPAISGFLPIRDEVDPRPLLAALASHGARLCLPVMQGRDAPLLFRAWSPGDTLSTVAWGIEEPTADKATLVPEVMLVPLLAADRRGNRLGYGAGYYDRTIAGIRAAGHALVAVGLAFDEQIIDAVPVMAYDEPLDWLLTPSGLIRCQGAA